MLAGIPGFHGGSTSPLTGHPPGYEEAYYQRIEANGVEREGHSNEDEIQPEWDLRGAAEDAELLRQLAWIIANAPSMPCWKVPSVFTTARTGLVRDPSADCRPRGTGDARERKRPDSSGRW